MTGRVSVPGGRLAAVLREAWLRALDRLEDAVFPPPCGLRPRRACGAGRANPEPGVINPGSGPVPQAGPGWTNTHEQARRNAERWLDNMRTDGIADVELLDPCLIRDGRWVFNFRHAVTGVEIELETHGLTDEGFEAYERERIFGPCVYWNGSSCSEPKVEDWDAPGYEVVKTLRRIP